jgi:uncharacterized membrane protein YfcA
MIPEVNLILVVAFLALVVGVLSGLLGIGGGVIMAPMLLLLPPLAGLGRLGVAVVTGITAVQSFVAAGLSAWAHAGRGHVDRKLVLGLGPPMWVAALVGSWLGAGMPPRLLEGVLAGLMSLAALLLVRPPQVDRGSAGEESVSWTGSPLLVGLLGVGIGTLSGVIGQGGGFLYLPAMVVLLRVPTRLAVATAAFVGIPSAALIMMGRVAGGHMPWALALATVPSLAVGTRVGAAFSYCLDTARLKRILAAVVALGAVELWRRLWTMQ